MTNDIVIRKTITKAILWKMDKLKDYWPLITIYLIVIGYSERIDYYRSFNINILSYLDITDIFQLQLSFYTFLNLLLIVLLIPVIIFYQLGRYKELEGKRSAFKSFIDSLWVSRTIIRLLNVLAVLVLGFSISAYLGRRQANFILGGVSINEVTLLFDKEIVRTDRTNVFIGQTKNYVFIYNRLAKQTTVYKLGEIKELKFSPGLDYIHQKL